MLGQFEKVQFTKGSTIIKQGDRGETFYIVKSGAVRVEASSADTDKTTVIKEQLGPSDFFGEMALLNPDGRAVASIRVRSYCEGYRLSRDACPPSPTEPEAVVALPLAPALMVSGSVRAGADDKLIFQFPNFREYLESVAKMRLRAKQAKKEHLSKDAELATFFETLNPTKRKLLAKGLTHEDLPAPTTESAKGPHPTEETLPEDGSRESA